MISLSADYIRLLSMVYGKLEANLLREKREIIQLTLVQGSNKIKVQKGNRFKGSTVQRFKVQRDIHLKL
ncbi:MAG: hypothetical protein NTV79_07580, partial [Candidatus Aureabacteria bacterium]|nr:hypothetical protein [Candidatus Auribacterota bacterium]